MNLHRSTTTFNCGIDLHADNMYVCIMDQQGKTLLHQNVKGNNFDYFLKIASPYLKDLTVCCESTFNWYWLSDACSAVGIKFVLGHALYMKAIHGTKTKNDRIDSQKIAHLLRSNMIPEAYCCSQEKRSIRDLLRRRIYLSRQRSALLCHMTESVQVHGHEKLSSKEKGRTSRAQASVQRFQDPVLQFSMKVDTSMVEQYDLVIKSIEDEILKYTRLLASTEYILLKTFPGIGKILGLVILYEIDNIDRFKTASNFSSYARLTPVNATSNGKVVGQQGRKIGNHYLKWAFSQVAVICKIHNKFLNQYARKLTDKYGKKKGNAMLSHRIGRTIFHMLKSGKVFDIETFLKGKIDMKQIKKNGRCQQAGKETVPQEDSNILIATQ